MRTIFVISGPSNTGKSTIVERLLKDNIGVTRIITSTSRAPRNNETNGVDYHFFTKEDFEQKINNNEFFEWACVYDDYKGILKKSIYEDIPHDKNIVITLDIQGYMNIKRNIDKSIYKIIGIFIYPPSIEELKRRMINRGANETDADLRINTAKQEIDDRFLYEYSVLNDNLENCIEEVKNIIKENSLI